MSSGETWLAFALPAVRTSWSESSHVARLPVALRTLPGTMMSLQSLIPAAAAES